MRGDGSAPSRGSTRKRLWGVPLDTEPQHLLWFPQPLGHPSHRHSPPGPRAGSYLSILKQANLQSSCSSTAAAAPSSSSAASSLPLSCTDTNQSSEAASSDSSQKNALGGTRDTGMALQAPASARAARYSRAGTPDCPSGAFPMLSIVSELPPRPRAPHPENRSSLSRPRPHRAPQTRQRTLRAPPKSLPHPLPCPGRAPLRPLSPAVGPPWLTPPPAR